MKTLKVKVYETTMNGYSSFTWERNSEDMKRLYFDKRDSEKYYYWYPGMTEWKKLSEFPFDNPPVIKSTFFDRLNDLFIIFWFTLNLFIIVLSLYLQVIGFEKDHIVKNDYTIGIFVLLFGYVIIYALFLSIVYIFTGKREDFGDLAGVLFVGVIMQILNGLYILKI